MILARVGFDTNALREWISGDRELASVLGEAAPVLPCIALEEAIEGWIAQARRDRQQRSEDRLALSLAQLARLHRLAGGLEVLDYTPSARYVFREITSGRGNRNRNDLRIAAICIAHGVPLLTRNVRDFSDIPGLAVQTW